jgi:protein-S-isoprenylcysteine O-methyltransferase Ste14
MAPPLTTTSFLLALLLGSPFMYGSITGGLFIYMALDEERVLAKSQLDAAFRDYRNRVGVLLVLPGRH